MKKILVSGVAALCIGSASGDALSYDLILGVGGEKVRCPHDINAEGAPVADGLRAGTGDFNRGIVMVGLRAEYQLCSDWKALCEIDADVGFKRVFHQEAATHTAYGNYNEGHTKVSLGAIEPGLVLGVGYNITPKVYGVVGVSLGVKHCKLENALTDFDFRANSFTYGARVRLGYRLSDKNSAELEAGYETGSKKTHSSALLSDAGVPHDLKILYKGKQERFRLGVVFVRAL